MAQKLTPENRILKLLEKKNYTMTALHDTFQKKKKIQFDVFKNKLQDLNNNGKIILIIDTITNGEGKIMNVNSLVKLKRRRK
jgi:hypothetical protein